MLKYFADHVARLQQFHIQQWAGIIVSSSLSPNSMLLFMFKRRV